MKKSLAIVFSILYLALSTGAAINVFYCGNAIKDVKLSSYTECCCGTDVTNSCCHSKELNLSIDIVQQIAAGIKIVPENLLLIIINKYGVDVQSKIDQYQIFIDYFNILPPKQEAIWLTNCALTYYG